jgi:hypothetical protein
VVAAYPITPQTHISEELSTIIADGELDAEFVKVESEFGAASVVLGASAAGARAYTATSSQGLMLMGEVLWNMAGMRLPVVLACANRSVSAPFDNEGVATVPRDVVRDGIVRGYFLGSYSARKLGMTTTGNAGGSHNLVIGHGDDDLPALLRRMGRGLFVTEQLGQGVNPVTGDFSRGAAGFWIEDGAIAYPVEEITIAGNLKDMFRDIVAVGNDVDRRGSRHTGSILLGRMTVAGR